MSSYWEDGSFEYSASIQLRSNTPLNHNGLYTVCKRSVIKRPYIIEPDSHQEGIFLDETDYTNSKYTVLNWVDSENPSFALKFPITCGSFCKHRNKRGDRQFEILRRNPLFLSYHSPATVVAQSEAMKRF